MKVTLQESLTLYCGYNFEASRFLTMHPEVAKFPIIINTINDGMFVAWSRATRPGDEWFIYGASADAPDDGGSTIWARHLDVS